MVIIQVFLMLSGSVPFLMVLIGGIQGSYDTFIKAYNDNGIVWILVLACLPIGLFWSWRDYKKGKL
jgi:hypothetical protein